MHATTHTDVVFLASIEHGRQAWSSNDRRVSTCVQVAVKNNFNRFLGRSDGEYSNLQRYSYHAAGGIGYFYGVRYAIVSSMPSPFPRTMSTCCSFPLHSFPLQNHGRPAVICDVGCCKRYVYRPLCSYNLLSFALVE